MATEYKLSYTASEIDAKLGQIEDLSVNKLDAAQLDSAIDTALAEAKASGEFKGDPYTLTEADKIEIVNTVLEALPAAEEASF